VEKIIETIEELFLEETDEIRRQLVLLCPPLIRRVRPRRPPIQIKGKPVSETIVEERRFRF
jgi:hypothetical protein